MKFPPAGDKGRQYEECSYILADTLGYMGHEISAATRNGWGAMMYRLATADDLSETQPQALASGEDLVSYLGITSNEWTLKAAQGMLDASARSINSTTIGEHLDSRRDEAVQSVALLRSQTPELITKISLWQEVDAMTIAGIYLDSLVDAKEDAGNTADFPAINLALSSTKRFIETVQRIKPKTRKAVRLAVVQHGLATYIIKSIPAKLLT